MKENYCKGCKHQFIKSFKDAVISEFGCRAGKEVITTIQDSFIPGISKTQYFSRPAESKCSCKEKRNKEEIN